MPKTPAPAAARPVAVRTHVRTAAVCRSVIKDLLICLSLGNLFFIQRWYYLEHLQSPAIDYFRAKPAGYTLLTSTLLATVILSAALWLLRMIVVRSANPRLKAMSRAGFLLFFAFPLETVRRYWNQDLGHADLLTNTALIGIELLLVAGAVMALLGNSRVFRTAERVASMMVFVLPVFLGALMLQHLSLGDSPSAYQAKRSAPFLPGRGVKAPRAIWILFDELDQRLAFDDRQPGVELPQLDRLRSESVVADHVTQTAGWTMLAVPSMLSGQIFSHSEARDASTLLVQRYGSERLAEWASLPNVFGRARQMGLNAAVVGWHHPYCREFGDQLVECDQVIGNGTDSLVRERFATDRGLWETTRLAFQSRWETVLDLFRGTPQAEHFLEPYLQKQQQQQYFEIRNKAYRDAVDPRIDLLFLHFPTPHLYAIYDRRRKDFTLSSKTTYFDNLALVDRTVGELRRELEKAGLWDSTAILITSDHGLRYQLWHGGLNWTPEFDRLLENGPSPMVPFILKLPGRTSATVVEAGFSNVVSGDILLEILGGRISTPSEVSAWLSKHAEPQARTPGSVSVLAEAARARPPHPKRPY